MSGTRSLESLEPRLMFVAGDLDPAFGGGGVARADFGGGEIAPVDVAAFGDRVYASGVRTTPDSTQGRLVLAAFDRAGRPEPLFGGDGTVVTTVAVRAAGFRGGSRPGEMLVQPDGKIVVVTGEQDPQPPAFTVARFNPNGTVDTSFGGDGHVELDIGLAVALAPGGKLVVSGAGPADRFAAVRLNPDGSFDNSFDGDGKIVLDFGNTNDSGQRGAVDVAVMPDGRIVLVGATADPVVDDVDGFDGWFGAIARLNPDGSYDTTFDQDGRLLWGGPTDNGVTAAGIGPHGEVLVGQMEGEAYARAVVLTGSGVLPRETPYPTLFSENPQIRRIHVTGDGKVVVSGTMRTTPLSDDGPRTFMARYNPDGSLDRGFAAGSYARPIGPKTALAPSGDVVALASDAGGLLVARYKGADTSDRTTVIEAESAPTRILSGAAVADEHPFYTGAGYVDFTANRDGILAFEVYSFHAGEHLVRFRYANGSRKARTMELYVGDGQAAGPRVTFMPTGSWSRWVEKTVRVTLGSGEPFATRHSVELKTIGDNGPNIDRLVVHRPPPPPTEGVYEAEDATLSGARVAASNPGFSGRGYADFANPAGDFVEWTVTPVLSNRAWLTFSYANGAASDRPLELRVNGRVVGPTDISFAPTGSWSSWRSVTAVVLLDNGPNTVRLTSVGHNGPNIDWLRVSAAR